MQMFNDALNQNSRTQILLAEEQFQATLDRLQMNKMLKICHEKSLLTYGSTIRDGPDRLTSFLLLKTTFFACFFCPGRCKWTLRWTKTGTTNNIPPDSGLLSLRHSFGMSQEVRILTEGFHQSEQTLLLCQTSPPRTKKVH
jgi:hypothetical protein